MGNRIMAPAVSIQQPQRFEPQGADRQSLRRHLAGECSGLRGGMDSDILREIREEAKARARKEMVNNANS